MERTSTENQYNEPVQRTSTQLNSTSTEKEIYSIPDATKTCAPNGTSPCDLLT